MNNFDIDQEIDALVDKTVDQLKIRLKKTFERHQKLMLKQYIASQKETRKDTKSSSGKLVSGRTSESKIGTTKKGARTRKDYNDSTDSEDDSD